MTGNQLIQSMTRTLVRSLPRTLAAAVLCAAGFNAHAGIINATAELSNDQEVMPSNPAGSMASGSAELSFDTDTGLLSINATIDGITLADITFPDGGLSFAGIGPFHIHNAPAGTNGGVVVPIGMESFFTDNGTGGMTISATDIPFEIPLLDELTAGNLYLNLHTLDFGSGEIRGQLASVPEPAGIVLLGGLLTLVGWRRKVKVVPS